MPSPRPLASFLRSYQSRGIVSKGDTTWSHEPDTPLNRVFCFEECFEPNIFGQNKNPSDTNTMRDTPVTIILRQKIAHCIALLSSGVITVTTLPAQVAPAPTVAAQNAGEVQQLPSFQVNDTEDKGYKASNAISGTGFNEKIQDLPFALTAITNEFITDIGATNLMDAASMAAGVKAATHYGTNGENAILIRGFQQYPEQDGVY